MNGGGGITGQNRGEVVERRKTDNERKSEKQRVQSEREELDGRAKVDEEYV